MKAYIITRVSSEGFYDGSESINFVGTDPEDVIKDAYMDYVSVWTDEAETDLISNDEFSKIMLAGFNNGKENIGNYVLIQFPESHTQYEPFAANLGYDIFDRSSFIATKMWNREDVFNALTEKGYEGTEDEIDAVISTGYLSALEDCTDWDWGIIYDAIEAAGIGNIPTEKIRRKNYDNA